MIYFSSNYQHTQIRRNYPDVAGFALKEEFAIRRNALEGKINAFKRAMEDYGKRHAKGALKFDLPGKFKEFHTANNPESLRKVVHLNLDGASSEDVRQGIEDMEHFENELQQFQRELSRLSKPEMQAVTQYQGKGLKGGCASRNGFTDVLGKALQLSRGYLSFGMMTFLNKLILALLPPGTSQEIKDLVNVLCTVVAVVIHEKCAVAAGSTVPSMYLRNPANTFWQDLTLEKSAWVMFTISREIETAVVKTMSEHMEPSMGKKVGDAFLSVIFTYLVAGIGVPFWQQAGRRYLGGPLKQNDVSSSQCGAYLKKVFCSTAGFEIKGSNLQYYGRGVFSMTATAITLLAMWFPVNKLVLPALFPVSFSGKNATQLQDALISQNGTVLEEFRGQMEQFLAPGAFDLFNTTLHELGPITPSTGQEVADKMNAGSIYEQMALSDVLFIAGSFMFYEAIAQLLRTVCCVNETPWKEVWGGRAPLAVAPVVERVQIVAQTEFNTVINPGYTELMPRIDVNANEENISNAEEEKRKSFNETKVPGPTFQRPGIGPEKHPV